MGFFTGEVAKGVEPPVIFFFLLPEPPVPSLFPCSAGTSQAAGAGQPRPGCSGHCAAERPQTLAVIQGGSREGTPTSSFYQTIKFDLLEPFDLREEPRPAPPEPRFSRGVREDSGTPIIATEPARGSQGSREGQRHRARAPDKERGGSAAPFPRVAAGGGGCSPPAPSHDGDEAAIMPLARDYAPAPGCDTLSQMEVF